METRQSMFEDSVKINIQKMIAALAELTNTSADHYHAHVEHGQYMVTYYAPGETPVTVWKGSSPFHFKRGARETLRMALNTVRALEFVLQRSTCANTQIGDS